MIKDIIFIENGSVDIDELERKLSEETLIVVYRQGSSKLIVEHLEKAIKSIKRDVAKKSNIKDKLIDIAKKAIASNGEVFEDIADKIIANLPELLADSKWIKLPCKVGDIVYVITYDKVYEAECNYIGIHSTGNTWVDLMSTIYPTTHTEYYLQDLNKTWFLTQGEAEVKLAEIKTNNKKER